MSLAEYQKKQRFQQRRVEGLINTCDIQNAEACAAVVRAAAEVAHTSHFQFRFGSFAGKQACIVYANMGLNNMSARDRFRRELVDSKVQELAIAVWPLDKSYTWAVFLLDDDAARWEDEARSAWLMEGKE